MCEIEYTEERNRFRSTVRIQKKLIGKPMELCLCSRCASQFYSSRHYYIKRADYNQTTKEPCTYCNIRSGYDYLVFDLAQDAS